ncbi:NEDD8 ultimate buster 1 [Senna tora]|uniref:NEDD8 ultimate buster 1 n=1 Tax=Senna tora TaxID=362788 RepID=A0A834SMV4_9FABA|nr:NEDD8 ultimate buster 1 [Senna tora]
MPKLKIAGTWSGVLEVELETWTLRMLREEVAKRSNCGIDSINLICAGKILKDGGDGQEKLSQFGIKNNSKILASRIHAEEGKNNLVLLLDERQRASKIALIKAAATALAQRHADGSLPVEDFNIEVEDQSGQKVHLGSETDQRAVMMGLMLHANGKRLIRQQNYIDALEVLSMGEEAFSLCDPKVIELIDNVPILQIDMVWCYFMIRDIRWLSEAGKRLEMARAGIERAHGKDSHRLRLLQGGRYPEVALRLRLELLEGVVAYHSGMLDKSRDALTSAKAKFIQLQVPDEALSFVMSMGFKERDVKRALRMNNQDVGGAIDFLEEEKAKKIRKREEDIRRRNEIRRQKRYGLTPLKKAVDIHRLKDLVSFEFEKDLAAEALRRNENDFDQALNDLTNPETKSAMQVHIETRKRKRLRKAAESHIENFVRMGFERSRGTDVIYILRMARLAIHRLTMQSEEIPASAAGTEANSSSAANTGAAASAPLPDNIGSNMMLDLIDDVEGLPEGASNAEVRDVEMEDELSADIAKADALADYDIEVNIEGEAITEYLALVESAGSSRISGQKLHSQ